MHIKTCIVLAYGLFICFMCGVFISPTCRVHQLNPDYHIVPGYTPIKQKNPVSTDEADFTKRKPAVQTCFDIGLTVQGDALKQCIVCYRANMILAMVKTLQLTL